MKKRFITGAVTLTTSILLGIGSVGAADKVKSDHPDWKFFKKAAQGGMTEVALGQMAANKAENEAVKSFGQQMVTDHGKANQELKDLAVAESVTLPTEMSADEKALQEKLSGLSGAEFDKAYMEEMLKDHKKDISVFQEEAQQGKDPEVKNWAEKTLPTLQEHYTLAQTTSSKIGVKR
jgi:putative membrane protein